MKYGWHWIVQRLDAVVKDQDSLLSLQKKGIELISTYLLFRKKSSLELGVECIARLQFGIGRYIDFSSDAAVLQLDTSISIDEFYGQLERADDVLQIAKDALLPTRSQAYKFAENTSLRIREYQFVPGMRQVEISKQDPKLQLVHEKLLELGRAILDGASRGRFGLPPRF